MSHQLLVHVQITNTLATQEFFKVSYFVISSLYLGSNLPNFLAIRQDWEMFLGVWREAAFREETSTIEAAIHGRICVTVALMHLQTFALTKRAGDFHIGLLDSGRSPTIHFARWRFGPVGIVRATGRFLVGRPAQAWHLGNGPTYEVVIEKWWRSRIVTKPRFVLTRYIMRLVSRARTVAAVASPLGYYDLFAFSHLIKVRAFGGLILTRVVVGVTDQVVLICKEEEYRAAAQEDREPVCIGFKLQDVVEPMVRLRRRATAS